MCAKKIHTVHTAYVHYHDTTGFPTTSLQSRLRIFLIFEKWASFLGNPVAIAFRVQQIFLPLNRAILPEHPVHVLESCCYRYKSVPTFPEFVSFLLDLDITQVMTKQVLHFVMELIIFMLRNHFTNNSKFDIQNSLNNLKPAYLSTL